MRHLAIALFAIATTAACGPSSTASDPGPDAGLPSCGSDAPTGLCTAAGVCTVDGMKCQRPERGGFPHPDAGADAN